MKLSCLTVGPLDAAQLTTPTRFGLQLHINTASQCGQIVVGSADDNASVLPVGGMKANKMPSVVRDYNPLFGNRCCQNLLIRSSLTGDSAFGCSPHIVPKLTQSLHDAKRKILVCGEPSHYSRCLVVDNLLLNLFAMLTLVRPSIGEIFGSQRRIVAK